MGLQVGALQVGALLLGTLLLGGCGPREGDGDEREEGGTEAPAPDAANRGAPLPGFGERTLGFLASADARIDSGHPDEALGGHTRLRVDANPRSFSLLRFDVSGLSSPVVSAKLRLYATAPSTGTLSLLPLAGGWDERAVTWTTRPRVVGPQQWLARPGVPDDAWVEFDVTDAVTRDGSYDFEVGINTGDGASFVSRESSLLALVPELLVDTAPTHCQPGPVQTREARWPDQVVAVAEATPDERVLRPRTLRVDGAPRREAYLRFGVDHRHRKLVSATLRLWAEGATQHGPAVVALDMASWGGTTWATRPTPTGAPLAELGAVSAGTWVEVDVTRALADRTGPLGSTGTGFDFAVALVPSGGDGVGFTSSYDDATGHRPHLALTYEVDCP